MLRAAVCLVLSSIALSAQGLEYVKANYTKYEFRIPMRDGKKLFTSVYVPKDESHKYPILLSRTPYSVGPYGPDRYKENVGPSDILGKEGYIFVYQDVRGRYMSEGEHVNMRPHLAKKNGPSDIDESTDTFDTIDWLVKNLPNHNGRVGMWGISYPGFYVAAGMIDAHPALKAVSPQAPIADWFVGDDFHRNGALYLPHAFNFFYRFGKPRPEPTDKNEDAFDYGTQDGYKFYLQAGPLVNINEKHYKNQIGFWNDIMKHGTYDEFWQSRNLRPHLKQIKPVVLTVGGWYDTENLFGALQVYKTVEKNSPGGKNMLVMGPWFHGQWARNDGESLGDVQFNAKTSVYYRENIEAPFFNYYLKDSGGWQDAEATVFETGSNVWHRFDSWPPNQAQLKNLYMHPGGKLSFDPPAATGAGFDEYISDPAKPVPYISQIINRLTREHMVDDQRFASTRTDVLVYQTDPLEEDVVIAGPIHNVLHVSTSGTDSDWIVKLIDVYPDNYEMPPPAADAQPPATPAPEKSRWLVMDGYQQLLRGEVFRGKFRNSFEKPEPFEPNKVTKIDYVMNDVLHNFRRGHRIMVQIQSSWFPVVDRNPQKFMDIYSAKESDFQKATQRVYRTPATPTHLEVNVMSPLAK